MRLLIPRYSYEHLRKLAEEFRLSYDPQGSIPVPIEEIVELHVGFDIIPMPGLLRDLDIDGFLTSDCSSIVVDEFVFANRRSRYRFTLAHEVAHAHLHRDLIPAIRPRSIRDLKEEAPQVTEEQRGWLEWQAYNFAALVLVPEMPLASAFRDVLQVADQAGLLGPGSRELLLPYLCKWISKRFEVSSQVVEKRVIKDRLWPLPE